MARTDTLTNFLTDVAEAIRTKGGTTDTINASEFDTAIANLPSGGGSGEVSEFESEYVAWLESDKAMTSSQLPLPSNATKIGGFSFYKLSNLSITSLPDSITSIGQYAFEGCSNLALTSLPSRLKSVDYRTFASCSKIKITSLPNTLTTLGQRSFYSCTGVAITSLPNGLTDIPTECFSGCTGITKLSIPSSVTSIGVSAFNGCRNIVEYDFSTATQVPTLSDTSAFNNINANCVIKVPSALYDEWIAATNWSTYADKIVAV